MLPSLNALSADWRRLTQRLVDSDYLRTNLLTNSLRVGREAGAPGGAAPGSWLGVAEPAEGASATHVDSSAPAEAEVEKDQHPHPSAPPLAPAKALRASPPPRATRSPRVELPQWFRSRERQPAYEVGEAAEGLMQGQQQSWQEAHVEPENVRSSGVGASPAARRDRLGGHAYLRLAESDDWEEGEEEEAKQGRERSKVKTGVLAKTRSVMARATAALAGADAVEAEVEAVHKAASAGLWLEATRKVRGWARPAARVGWR